MATYGGVVMVLMVLLFLLLWLLLCADDGVRAYVDDGDGGDGEMMVCVRMRWCCPQKECSSFCVASAGEGKSCRRDKGGMGGEGGQETCKGGRRLGRGDWGGDWGGRRLARGGGGLSPPGLRTGHRAEWQCPSSCRHQAGRGPPGNAHHDYVSATERNGNALPPAGTWLEACSWERLSMPTRPAKRRMRR